MPLTATNAPPTDPNLLNRNIVRGPRLVDVGAPEPVPAPSLVDVGTPEPVAVPRLVDVGKPAPPSIEELVGQIDTDLNFFPSDEQLTEYFAYKDEQPFSFKKTWDAGVNAVGMALSDITKAVGAAATDPAFRFNPAKLGLTVAEGAARGTWDLSILGKMMINKLDELVVDSPAMRKAYFSQLRDKHNKNLKPGEKPIPTRGNLMELAPDDLKDEWESKYRGTLNDRRIEKWRTMRYILNTRNLAREGKKTILGEFLGEKADKALLPFINQEVAEGSSYILDPTLPVGFVSAPVKATAKPLISRLTKSQLLERGLVAPTVEFTGRTLKDTGKKVDEIISNIGAKVEENTDIVKPAMTGASAVVGAAVAPESVGMLGGAVAGAVGGKYGLPQLGKLKAIPKAITIAGEGVEAIGKSMGKPEMLESTLQQAARIAESEPARKILKGAARLDPAISLVDNLVTGAIEGSKAGGILASPSGDEEFIGGAMGTGATLGGGGGVVGGKVGEKYRTKKQAENTVNEWFNSKTEAEQKAIQNLKLTPVESASVATAEMLGRGIIGKDKISDMNFKLLSQEEFIKKIHPELLVDGEVPKILPLGTRGAQASVDGTPTIYVNTGHTGPRSLFHEMMHAMLKFDELSDHRAELRSQLFDQKTEDGTVLKRGMFSEDDIDVFFDQYLSRLPEESRAAWEEQFKVYKDDFEEVTGPDGTKELKRVIDAEATRKNEHEYVMEEVEAESFANFVKESGPTFLQQSRSIRQMIVDRFLLQDNLKKTRVLRSVLEKWGVPFGADGTPTGVFWKDGKPISNNREINKVMREFVRAKDSVTRRMMEDEGGERPALSIGSPRAAEGRKKVEAALKSADGKLLVEHFKTNDIFDRKPNGDIKYDALTGMPILLGEKQIKKLQVNRLEKIQAALEEVGIDGGGMLPKKNKDGSISWSGIPTDAQVKKILEIPNDVIPPGMKDSIVDIVEKMRLPGQSIIMDYNPALGRSGRYSSNLSSGLRVAVPLGFHVSKAGNFYVTTLDMGAVTSKLSDWGNPDGKTHKNLAMWDGDAKRFQQDMFKYLENHKADRTGDTGLDADAATAMAKKDIINDFFNVAQKDSNPITDARKATKRSGKARKVENLLRTRRFDRMNRIEKNRLTKYGAGTPLPMKTQADAYEKWKKNLMPGDEVRYMPGEATRPPVDDLGFYSRVAEVAAGDKIPTRATGEQMLATIVKQPGVKKEEIAWLGLEDFLRGKDRVTKEELGEFIRENDVRLEETVFESNIGKKIPIEETRLVKREDPISGKEKWYRESIDQTFREEISQPIDRWIAEGVIKSVDEYNQYQIDNVYKANGENFVTINEYSDVGSIPQYEKYQLPGAEPGSYREMVLRLPSRPSTSFAEYLKAFKERFPNSDESVETIRVYWRDEYDPASYKSPHFSEPNILAHVRFNDRTGPNGEKILFVEEVQSDWHREGRKSGYRKKDSETVDDVVKLAHEDRDRFYSGKGDMSWDDWNALSERVRQWDEREKSAKADIPDAPFKTSWHELVMKRMLRHAAENGYEKLAWISGDETAKRYDLSTKIEMVSWNPSFGKFIAAPLDRRMGGSIIRKATSEELPGIIGKEVAKRLLDSPKDESGSHVLTGEEIKVGGEWASNLYDRMIPQFMKKYGKKFGAKVEDVAVVKDFSEYDSGRPIPKDQLRKSSFKAIDITPAMTGDVMGGQVKFMPGVDKFDTIEPSIISESVKIKPGAFDNVRFMPGAARIPLADIANSDPFIMLSDRMADTVHEVPGTGVKIPLHGGPGFSYRSGEAVWASTRNAATKIGNYVNKSGKNRALIMIQREDNHAKNPSMGHVFVEELKAREKNITKTDMNKMLRAASKRAGLKKAIKNVGELEAAYRGWDWDTRGGFFGQFGLVNKPHSPIGDPRKRGFFDYHQIIKDTTDPALADLPTGAVVGAIEFDGGKTYSASELGTVPHTSYDTMLKGRGLGLFENPPHISEILDVPESQRSVFTLSRRFTSPNRLKEAAQMEAEKIIKMPTEEKAKRKDRAMELLKKFAEQ